MPKLTRIYTSYKSIKEHFENFLSLNVSIFAGYDPENDYNYPFYIVLKDSNVSIEAFGEFFTNKSYEKILKDFDEEFMKKKPEEYSDFLHVLQMLTIKC